MSGRRNFKTLLVMAVILLGAGCVTAVAEPNIIYVDPCATGAGDGTSWGDAYPFFQDALADANSDPDVNQIRVAQGTYTPDSNSADPEGNGNREATFQLINGVAIYSGFPTGGGPWASRDPNAYETILSGDLNGDDVGFINNGENSYHVVKGSGMNNTAVLDGFTITGGNANGFNYPDDVGGGIYNVGGNPTLPNCTFTGNTAFYGGGMYNGLESSPTVTGCNFSGNSAISGGGMCNYDNSDPTVTNCTFSGNLAWYGGGMYNGGSSPIVTNCTFSGNEAKEPSPMYEVYGGGMCNEDHSRPTITNCTFSGNFSDDNGGGMYNQNSSPKVTNCILWGNYASFMGDQIYNSGMSWPTVSYSDVAGGYSGTGNIDANPLFVNAGGGDLHLLPGSPCIDVGDNSAVPVGVTTDMDGNPRFVDGGCCNGIDTVDMGAYEYEYCHEPVIIYVDEDATGANDGSSWADAYNYLQEALATDSSCYAIWVADGTYTPDSHSAEPDGSGDREATFQLINGGAIYGGFEGTEDPCTFDLAERDFVTNETILSGDINTPDVNSDNSYHVVTGSGTNANAILDGFTITAGNANGDYPYDKGGGMYNDSGSPTVGNCSFTGNSTGAYGGGMLNCNDSSPTLTNCMFSGNSAVEGGGMLNFVASVNKCNPILTNCTFKGNSAALFGGGLRNFAVSSGGECNPILNNCTFSGNSAGIGGGGMANSAVVFDTCNPILTNCILWDNTAPIGPEIYNSSSTPIVTYSDIAGGYSGNNIDEDPLFVDADGPDNIVGTEDDNLRLLAGSPCIDAGDNNSVPADTTDFDNDGNTIEPIPWDLDGRDRFADGDCNDTVIVDMGAFEFAWVYIGDFAGGCDVDLVDFSVLGLTWQLEEQEAGYDPNCDISLPADGVIDERDFKIFTDNWLFGK